MWIWDGAQESILPAGSWLIRCGSRWDRTRNWWTWRWPSGPPATESFLGSHGVGRLSVMSLPPALFHTYLGYLQVDRKSPEPLQSVSLGFLSLSDYLLQGILPLSLPLCQENSHFSFETKVRHLPLGAAHPAPPSSTLYLSVVSSRAVQLMGSSLASLPTCWPLISSRLRLPQCLSVVGAH